MGLFRRRKKALIVGSGPTRPHRSGLLRRFRSLGIAAVVATAVFFGLRHEGFESSQRAVLVEMEQIAKASLYFRQDLGRCPHDLGELTHPPAGATPYLARESGDPWGRPYFFQCPGRWDVSEVDIASMGPDGAWLGGDDITTDL